MQPKKKAKTDDGEDVDLTQDDDEVFELAHKPNAARIAPLMSKAPSLPYMDPPGSLAKATAKIPSMNMSKAFVCEPGVAMSKVTSKASALDPSDAFSVVTSKTPTAKVIAAKVGTPKTIPPIPRVFGATVPPPKVAATVLPPIKINNTPLEEKKNFTEETDADEDDRLRLEEKIGFKVPDTTLNVLPADRGNVLMNISEGGLQYMLAGARANVGIKKGRYMFEVKIVELVNQMEAAGAMTRGPVPRNLVRVGVCVAGVQPILGDTEDSVCFDSEGNFACNKKRTAASKRFSTECTIGILLNLDPNSSNMNTISMFKDGIRVSKPQILPDFLHGKTLYPAICFKNVTVHMNFGPTLYKPPPFKCRCLQDAAEDDVEIAVHEEPTDGMYDVVFPVFLPEEGTFEWLDWFLQRNPHFTEISDRVIVDWAVRSGLWRPKPHSPNHSNDKPEMNLGIPGIDDGTVKRLMVQAVGAQNRHVVVMEVKGNLMRADRTEVLKAFRMPHRQRLAWVMIGEPDAEFKGWVHDQFLDAKREAEIVKMDPQRQDAARAKMMRDRKKKIEQIRRRALQNAQGGGVEEADIEMSGAEESDDEHLLPSVELTDEEKYGWFKKFGSGKDTADVSQTILGNFYSGFMLPSEDEPFDKVEYRWYERKQAEDYRRDWVSQRKMSTRVDDLHPSGWFKDKLQEWQANLQAWHANHVEFKEPAKRAALLTIKRATAERTRTMILCERAKKKAETEAEKNNLGNSENSAIAADVEMKSAVSEAKNEKDVDMATEGQEKKSEYIEEKKAEDTEEKKSEDTEEKKAEDAEEKKADNSDEKKDDSTEETKSGNREEKRDDEENKAYDEESKQIDDQESNNAGEKTKPADDGDEQAEGVDDKQADEEKEVDEEKEEKANDGDKKKEFDEERKAQDGDEKKEFDDERKAQDGDENKVDVRGEEKAEDAEEDKKKEQVVQNVGEEKTQSNEEEFDPMEMLEAEIDRLERDVFTCENILNIGDGEPIFFNFMFEDWALMTLRFELHLLLHAFRRDVGDADRPAFLIEHLNFYYTKYFKKNLIPKNFGLEKLEDLLALVQDTIIVHNRAVEPMIEGEMENNDIFLKLTEEARRTRQKRIDGGDQSAVINIVTPHTQPGPNQVASFKSVSFVSGKPGMAFPPVTAPVVPGPCGASGPGGKGCWRPPTLQPTVPVNSMGKGVGKTFPPMQKGVGKDLSGKGDWFGKGDWNSKGAPDWGGKGVSDWGKGCVDLGKGKGDVGKGCMKGCGFPAWKGNKGW